MTAYASYVPFVVNDNSSVNGIVSKIGQTFSSGPVAFNLTDIDLSLAITYNPHPADLLLLGTITANIYAIDGSNNPTGDALSTGSIEAVDISVYEVDGTSPTWTNIVMSNCVLAINTTYILVLTADNPGSAYSGRGVQWFGTSLAGYSKGVPRRYVSEWESDPVLGDHAFRVNGVVDPTGYIDLSVTIASGGSLTGTIYLTATPSESFDPPVATGLNFMKTIRRLTALAQNTFYYEDV